VVKVVRAVEALRREHLVLVLVLAWARRQDIITRRGWVGTTQP